MFYKVKQVILMLTALKHLLGLLEPIVNAIKQFETPGNGAEKKQAVLDFVKAAVVAAEGAFGTDIPEEKVIKFISQAIDGVVGFYNAIGVFRHSSASEKTI